jgi:hypothetical protein
MAASTSGRLLNVKGSPIVAEITTGTEPAAAAVPTPETAAPAPIDWMLSGGIVVIGNVVLLTLLGGVWLVLGQRKKIPANAVTL